MTPPQSNTSYFLFDDIDETTFFELLEEITTLNVNTHFKTTFDKQTVYNNINFIDDDYTNLINNISLKHPL